MASLLYVISLLIGSAYAQSDQYWQQVCSAKDSQSSQMMVNLLRQLDEANKQIADLRKQIEGEKK